MQVGLEHEEVKTHRSSRRAARTARHVRPRVVFCYPYAQHPHELPASPDGLQRKNEMETKRGKERRAKQPPPQAPLFVFTSSLSLTSFVPP